jgi:hypothetical protein
LRIPVSEERVEPFRLKMRTREEGEVTWVVVFVSAPGEGDPAPDDPEVLRVRADVVTAADAKAELLELTTALARGVGALAGVEVSGHRFTGPGAPA